MIDSEALSASDRDRLAAASASIEAGWDSIPEVLHEPIADVIGTAAIALIRSREAGDDLRQQRDHLLEANNRYLERARRAEATLRAHEEVGRAIGASRERTIKRLIDERDAWKKRWEKATGQSHEQFPLQAQEVDHE